MYISFEVTSESELYDEKFGRDDVLTVRYEIYDGRSEAENGCAYFNLESRYDSLKADSNIVATVKLMTEIFERLGDQSPLIKLYHTSASTRDNLRLSMSRALRRAIDNMY